MQTDTGKLKKIFESFDLDKSGSIDIKELGKVAEQLDKKITPQQLAKIVKKLDTNGDGKISYGEFQFWWVKGMEGGMSDLVYLQAKSLKLKKFVQKKLNESQIKFENSQKLKPDKYSFKVSFGAPKEDSIKINVGVYLNGPKEQELLKRIKTYIPDLKKNTFGLVIKLPSKNPSQAKAALDHALNSALSNESLPFQIESLQQNPYLRIKTVVKQKQLLLILGLQTPMEDVVTPIAQEVEGALNQIGEGFYTIIEANVSVNSSFDQILSDSPLNNLLRGFEAGVHVESNKQTLGKFRKMAEKQEMQVPAFANLLTLFRSTKLHLKIKTPDQLNTFFKKLGIDDIIGGIPTATDILQQLSVEVKKSLGTDPQTKLIYSFSKFIFKHVQNDVQLFFLAGPLGTGTARFQGKNATKIHSILFNQI